MLTLDENEARQLRTENLHADLVVVGGGMAGTCAAITAARQGMRVVLVQDRPVLGGNASSEIRLWMVGASSHMGNNNRWAREGGVVNEILMENLFRSPEGNPVLFDTILLEKVHDESNIQLLLNTAVYEVTKDGSNGVKSVSAFCSQNSTRYVLTAPYFCDASGDGIVGFLAGAAFRIGAESHQEFGELLAPYESSKEVLGHSIYFYTRDTGRSVRYVAPSYALTDIKKIPRYRRFSTKSKGTDLWWIEYGGSRDTVHETESIKWELWKVIYGVWNYIKNSGEFPDADNLTLDWVGLIPGKRESRRFEGEYMLVQQDIVEQRTHNDAVSYGGWAIDHHPVDNIYSSADACTQWHSKGVYQIPFRTMYSRNVRNLFLTGRLISVSHIAFGSTRVMATCAHNGQAVGMAATVCKEQNLQPHDLLKQPHMQELQTRLLRTGQWIPHVRRADRADLVPQATLTASSSLYRLVLAPDTPQRLEHARALMVPMVVGETPELTLRVRHHQATELVAELRTCSHASSYTPDVVLDTVAISLSAGGETAHAASGGRSNAPHLGLATTSASRRDERINGDAVVATRRAAARASECVESSPQTAVTTEVALRFTASMPTTAYAFICLQANELVEVFESRQLVTAVTTVNHCVNAKVHSSRIQSPPSGSGIEEFEFWIPRRRPHGRNLAATVNLHASTFAVQNVANGFGRPTNRSNAWVADPKDPLPSLTLEWTEAQQVRTIEIVFDADWDHPMENVMMEHPEREIPTVVRNFRILGPDQELLFEGRDNHMAMATVRLAAAINTRKLSIELEHPSDLAPASLYEVRCYS